MHQVLLLRRVKSAGAGSGAGSGTGSGAGSGAGHRYHYRLESRLLAVGCTCIRPVVRRQD
ncbi:hypothetical protein EYF80_060729 [Liparis tanakae]|uniref:Uncharacterized protein n=1 Tax=Liparis tanakae TaxID=230148 RepID=A0A4Z2EJU0_9TELE|nr:hypothetical protein EYF80_060729 [Liparis tanakae]